MEISFTVENQERLDTFLKSSFNNVNKCVSRNYVQELISRGKVKINEIVCNKSSTIVRYGDTVCVCVNQENSYHQTQANQIELEIIYEDKDIIVLNKQSNLVVHPAHGHEDHTLLNGLIHYCGLEIQENSVDYEDACHENEYYSNIKFPALVHRLDKDTTGVMVIAKTPVSYQSLTSQFFSKTAQRKYYAFVWGRLEKESDTVSTYIARSPKDRKKMTVFKNSGKVAITNYKVKKEFYIGKNKYISLVECSLETGRTHQIRVHMKYIGHPVIGDGEYCSAISQNYIDYLCKNYQSIDKFIQRQALHSYSLKLQHPTNDQTMLFEAKIPDDMKLLYNFCNSIS